MPLQTVENRRLYRQIADQIAALIEKGEYGAGERLPPERDLAKQLGVSRPSVREALIALEVEGLVEVRIGSGIYVLAPGGAGDVAAANDSTAGPDSQTLVVALYYAVFAAGVRAPQSVDAMAMIYMAVTLVWLLIALRFVNPTQLVSRVKEHPQPT